MSTIKKKSTQPKIQFPTCNLCAHYQPFTSSCGLKGKQVDGYDMESPAECKKDGSYMRYTNAVPHFLNYYGDESSLTYKGHDLSRCAVNEEGIPIFVETKRGIEIPVPANDSVKIFTCDLFHGVPLIETYQGQRQLIYEIGVELAQKEAQDSGVELTVLDEERDSQGFHHYIEGYYNAKSQRTKKRVTSMASEPIPEW